MKTTGYALRDAMKDHELAKELAEKSFKDSLKKFDSETKPPPTAALSQFEAAERAMALLESAQVKYNLAVKVEAPGFEAMNLLNAIKLVGIFGRLEKTCKSAIEDPTHNPYEFEVDPTKARVKRTLSAEEATRLTKHYGKMARSLRAAVATANATVVDIEGLDPTLFEG